MHIFSYVSFLLLTALVFAAYDASAQETVVPTSYSHLGLCNEYEKSDSGKSLPAYTSAVQFSEGENNDIGVVVYTGHDVDPALAVAVADKAANLINDDDLVAECFVGPHRPDKATSYAYVINGFAHPSNTTGLNLNDFVETLKSAKGEANLIRAHGMKGKDEHKLSTITLDKD